MKSTLKGTELRPFCADPFSEEVWCAEEQTGCLGSCLSCRKQQKISQVYQLEYLNAIPDVKIP